MGKVGKTSCLDDGNTCCMLWLLQRLARSPWAFWKVMCMHASVQEVASSYHCYGHSIPKVVDMVKGDSGL